MNHEHENALLVAAFIMGALFVTIIVIVVRFFVR